MKVRSLCALVAILSVVARVSLAVDDEKMLHVAWRPIDPTYPKDAFEMSTRHVWRLGDTYIRVEEAPDPIGQIHGLVIIAEPHLWVINLYDKTGRHVIDPGPTFVAHYPVFVWESSAEMLKLEIGREIAFFNQRNAKSLPEHIIDGVNCRVLRLEIDGRTVTLYINQANEVPFQIETQGGPHDATLRYEKYKTDLAPDLTKFEPPPGISFTEAADPN